MLENKHILLGVTGGIAAYKSAELVRRLRDAGAEVRVVMTAAAKALVTPLTFQALSGHAVLSEWDEQGSEFAMDHIALTRWADAILIAPGTADFMAKLAHGFADDILSTLCLAATVPIILAPAMNKYMWENQATQLNKQQLQKLGIHLIGPDVGSQACGDIGLGRMEDIDSIVQSLHQILVPRIDLTGLRLLITAGPTQEPIDPVRFISNHSSGKMGYALAQAAVLAGAKVVLITGPSALTTVQHVEKVSVNTAQEMYDAVMARVTACDIFIGVAAVADYHCVSISSQKIKKNEANLTLTLKRTPDILQAVANLEHPPFTVGFAAETENMLENARVKLQKKNVNVIVANDVAQSDLGFNVDENRVTALWATGEKNFPRSSKQLLAHDLLECIGQLYTART
jgi:phosphopantothenoylcysteine decarboxylase / phosphopantothenate---cysteine ligase